MKRQWFDVRYQFWLAWYLGFSASAAIRGKWGEAGLYLFGVPLIAFAGTFHRRARREAEALRKQGDALVAMMRVSQMSQSQRKAAEQRNRAEFN